MVTWDKVLIWCYFEQLAKKYHPDHNKDENASAKFTEVGEAYEVMFPY